MVRMVRISTALLFALMMMIATAGAAQAFDPPDNDNASGLCGVALFPAIGVGQFPMGGGPWNATPAGLSANPSGRGIDFINAEGAICSPPPPP
jgi:hypothetical protein